uniref:NADH-ubiquinone oxidoreductase chain 2 n=1 Tax=Petroscirtes breviceps TaxID=57847 RepID=Q8HKU9_PETBE|nr:NADH dehydrogenase subunit 2 [Petroscirtes breviceps]BAC23749.1 NADH dehydrogenase subunit 2 [Petroscirtes breviceps]
MSPIALTISLTSMFIGTLLTITSSHWLTAWMGLEINTIAILPLMASRHLPRSVEACTKYFLMQAPASALFLFAATSNAWSQGQWETLIMTDSFSTICMLIALMTKMGLAPMYAWFPEVTQGLNMTTALILCTWQKIAPLILLSQIQLTDPTPFLVVGALSALIGGWGGLNQTQLRKMLAYSSISHSGWIMVIMQLSPNLALFNFLVYCMITTAAFLTFKTFNTTNFFSLSIKWSKAPILALCTATTLMSLGGIPPLLGFAPKLLILKMLLTENLALLACMMAFFSLPSLFFYVRTVVVLTLTTISKPLSSSSPWRILTLKSSALLAWAIMASALFLPISPLILSLLVF